jgi:hypothetical protein
MGIKIKDPELAAHLEEVSEQVRHWPKWMGGEGVEPLCCPTCNRPLDKKTRHLAGDQDAKT